MPKKKVPFTDKRGQPSRPPAKFKEDMSVLVTTLQGVQLRLTQHNRLFILFHEQIAWPYLLHGMVKFDIVMDDTYKFPVPAMERIKRLLEKQAEIRRLHELDFDEDEGQYTYS